MTPLAIPLALLLCLPAQARKERPPSSSKEAMGRVQVLVGEWRITGQGEDDDKFWTDTLDWTYKDGAKTVGNVRRKELEKRGLIEKAEPGK